MTLSILSEHYTFDSLKNIYYRFGYQGIPYSDGDVAEARMLDILQSVDDVSVMSDELLQHQTDWPTTYHLSSKRANLLRPLDDALRDKKVLELGCGCGAVTRYLGETAKEVIAVEGSFRRAEITALRCKGLPDVFVVVDKIQDLQLEPHSFDVVTLIGVLEYSRVFGGFNAEAEILKQARGYLRSGGVLILAIENQLGLKYFAGVPEDHQGVPWWGINDAYTNNSVATFSRNELEQLLKQASFRHIEQCIPMPDYKLPTTVILPIGINAPQCDFNRSMIMPRLQRPFEANPLFSLHQAWRVVNRAGLQRDLADSLFFVACCEKPAKSIFCPNVLACHYGDVRFRKFAKETLFCMTDNGVIVKRRPLSSKKNINEEEYSDFLQSLVTVIAPSVSQAGTPKSIMEEGNEPYSPEETLYSRICALVARKGWSEDELAQCIAPWVKWLRDNCNENGLLPAWFVDATPFNVSVNCGGDVFYFDAEWIKRDENLTLDSVALRGLFYALLSIEYVDLPAFSDVGILSVCERVFRRFDIIVNKALITKTFQDDQSLSEFVYGRSASLEVIFGVRLNVCCMDKTRAIYREAVLYLDYGSGFSDDNAVKKIIVSSNPFFSITENFEIPAGVQKIRFDPAVSFCVVQNLSINSEFGRLSLETNGYKIDEGYIFFTSDPQIFISDEKILSWIRIDAQIYEIGSDVFTRCLKRYQDDAIKQVSFYRNSLSWRITKPLRAIQNFYKTL